MKNRVLEEFRQLLKSSINAMPDNHLRGSYAHGRYDGASFAFELLDAFIEAQAVEVKKLEELKTTIREVIREELAAQEKTTTDAVTTMGFVDTNSGTDQ
ncbi:hypothetical protein QTI05_24030 [Variovorax sp. J22R193]|uniref:hypothetical protein n=1 Tax=Variovorax fucosicus TaxID=3053517 RepID=UPI002576BE91|nr:hypothetical protein [Variovorax sp. J22R193]MDM0042128.1 hypothetical protein [Variovorax sp. J22R193]